MTLHCATILVAPDYADAPLRRYCSDNVFDLNRIDPMPAHLDEAMDSEAWALAHWGTPGNAQDTEIGTRCGDFAVRFKTPEGAPDEALRVLARSEPMMIAHFACFAREYCGEGEISNGAFMARWTRISVDEPHNPEVLRLKSFVVQPLNN